MYKPVEMKAKRYGRWIVIRRAGSNNCGQATWWSRCDCGTVKVVNGNSLRSGISLSCGCTKAYLRCKYCNPSLRTKNGTI